MKLTRFKLKSYRSSSNVRKSHGQVTDDLFRQSQSAFAEKLDFLKDDLRKDFIAKNREPLSIQVQALRKSMDLETHQAKLSTQATEMLENEPKLTSLADLPEPELPEAFCKRFGVKFNYNYIRDDVGPRIDRYCQRNHAYLEFKRHQSVQSLLNKMNYEEQMQTRIITQAKKQRAQEIKNRLKQEEDAKRKANEVPVPVPEVKNWFKRHQKVSTSLIVLEPTFEVLSEQKSEVVKSKQSESPPPPQQQQPLKPVVQNTRYGRLTQRSVSQMHSTQRRGATFVSQNPERNETPARNHRYLHKFASLSKLQEPLPKSEHSSDDDNDGPKSDMEDTFAVEQQDTARNRSELYMSFYSNTKSNRDRRGLIKDHQLKVSQTEQRNSPTQGDKPWGPRKSPREEPLTHKNRSVDSDQEHNQTSLPPMTQLKSELNHSLSRLIDSCETEIPKAKVKFLSKIKDKLAPVDTPQDLERLEKELEKKISQRYFKYDQQMLEQRMQVKETLRISESLSRFQRSRPDVVRKFHGESEQIYVEQCYDQRQVLKEVEDAKLDIQRHKLFAAYNDSRLRQLTRISQQQSHGGKQAAMRSVFAKRFQSSS